MKLRKGDRVRVIAGKDLGREGVIMRVLPDKNRVIVEGVNVAKKHQRPQRATMQAGIIDKDMPIEASNVALVCGSCRGPTRIGYRFDANGNKVRVCAKCRGDI
ncbi:MAG: 50S ribosomal protein L24 [Actinomycetota bacterium]|jgi:large subunit ribosomal protein L24|nr:50S ribosomal protein L24 [Actinomycetota bacterium]